MGVESATEAGLRAAFRAVSDTWHPDDHPAYRCFFLDDATHDSKERREYPLVEITASPNVPTQHRSTFRNVPVALKFATHRSKDPKRAALVSMYEALRAVIDAVTGITIAGYSVIGIIIESGGESGVEENEHYITLPLTVKLCGA